MRAIAPQQWTWNRSPSLDRIPLLLTGLALAATSLAHLPRVAALLVGVGILGSLLGHCRRAQRAEPWCLQHDNTGWYLQGPGISAGPWHIHPLSRVTAHSVFLMGCATGQRWPRCFWIPRDALAPDAHRQLRVRLRLSPDTVAEPELYCAPRAGSADNPG